MTFAEALREWGARSLETKRGAVGVDRSTVTVEWGAETTHWGTLTGDSTEMTIEISGRIPNGGVCWDTLYGYGMATLVRELDAIASERGRT